MNGHVARLSRENQLLMYEIMYKGRTIDEKISESVKTSDGLIPTGGFVTIGEEAVSAGAAMALNPKLDWVGMQHRCKPGYIRFGVTPYEDFMNQGCRKESSTGGRDGTVHYAFVHRHVLKFISHMGAQVGAACGVVEGLRYLYDLEKREGELPVCQVYFGDGAAQQGIIHEAMNYAATRNLPVIFVIDNNHISTVTRADGEYAGRHLFPRALGYNIGWRYVENGNDVVAVYNAAYELVERARSIARCGPGESGPTKGEVRAPAILECNTFRWSAHNESFMLQDVDLDEWREWRARDPVRMYRNFLLELRSVEALKKVTSREPRAMRLVEDREFSEEEIIAIEKRVKAEVEEAYAKAKAMENPDPKKDGLGDVYPPTVIVKKERIVEPLRAGLRTSFSNEELKSKRSFMRSLQDVIRETLRADKRVRYFGEDVRGHGNHMGGVSGKTLLAIKDPDILEEQVFNTPLSEMAIIGSAIGQSLVGIKPIAEIQYMPFMSVGISQLTDYAATHYYTTHTPIQAMFTMQYGGPAGGDFHSNTRLEATLFHTPGIKMVDPSTPADVAGLFRSAMKTQAPVIFKTNVWAFSRIYGDPAPDGYEVQIGIPALRKEGTDLTIITWGPRMLFDVVAPAITRLEAEGHSIELIELRSIQPYDLEFLVDSVRRTRRALVVHQDVEMGGVGESIASAITKDANFDMRAISYGAAYTPTPQHPNLEQYFLPSADGVYKHSMRLLKHW
ncbi:hypothetical protein HY413_01205 [Candidatus Kaiserbacteria bacterium]|nr:hypothetical protein [Candidatus Kaiserbacteria bacterium]